MHKGYHCKRPRVSPVIKTVIQQLPLSQLRVRRAGIIIYTSYQGQIYFGLGLDSFYHELTDFGGRVEKRDRSPVATAIREFEEETLGIFEPLQEPMIGQCPVLYDKSNLILFLYLEGIDPDQICQRFNQKYQELKDSYPEVCGLTWLSWPDFRACIYDQDGPLFYRVRHFLLRAGDFTTLL